MTGAGLPPLRLGGTNIDHVVLSGDGLAADRCEGKGCGSGHLQVLNGKGVLVREGTVIPQPWMDDRKAQAKAGALVRLTEGKLGFWVWVVPDATRYDSSISQARFLKDGGWVLTPSDIAAGALNELLPVPAPPADIADIKRISARLSTYSKTAESQLGAGRMPPLADDN